jgi:hypothetical protein
MVVINFIHWLVGPVVRWHRAYEAKIVCHYLLEHDRDVQRAIELFREERKVGPSKRSSIAGGCFGCFAPLFRMMQFAQSSTRSFLPQRASADMQSRRE